MMHNVQQVQSEDINDDGGWSISSRVLQQRPNKTILTNKQLHDGYHSDNNICVHM